MSAREATKAPGQDSVASGETGATDSFVVIDLGKASSDRVKKLRKGRGPLMRDVLAAVEEARGDAKADPGSKPVIVIVERKRKMKCDLFPY